jgi:hypothetical protein
MRTARLRQEAALLASICQMLGLLALSQVRPLPDTRRALLLCQAFETYRRLVADAQISFEHAVLLLRTLTSNEELSLDQCRDCAALLVVDRLSLRVPKCYTCATI